MPRDGFGREIDYLRFSLTDHCNLRCVYCMPETGLRFLPAAELLTAAEIEQVGRAALAVGFRKIPPDGWRADAAGRSARRSSPAWRICLAWPISP